MTAARTVRRLGRGDLVLLVLNTVVGAGVIALPGRIYAVAGRNSLAALGVAVVAALMFAAMFAVLARQFAGSGGPYLYVGSTLGRTAGRATGWLMIATRALSGATSLRVFAETVAFAGSVDDARGRSLILGAIWTALTGLALRGVIPPIRIGNAIGAVKLILLGATALAGVAELGRYPVIVMAHDPIEGGFAGAAILWFYALSGFEGPTILAAESANPRRDLPFALLTGVALAGVLYAALMLVCMAFTPVLATQSQPLLAAARALFPGVTPILAASVAIIVGASLPSQFTLAPRLLATMAVSGDAPPSLRPDRSGTSQLTVLAYAVVVLLTGSALAVHQLVVFAATVRLLVYAGCAVGFARSVSDRPMPTR